MKFWNQQRALQILLCVVALATLVNCGSSKNSSNFGSNDSPSADPAAIKDSLALCSEDVAGNADLKVRLMQYVDAYGQARPDYVRLQFMKIPAGWSSSSWDLNIRRWAVSADNKSSMDSTPLFYQFERKVTNGFQLMTNYSYQVFNWEEVEQMSEYAELDPQGFFNNVTLLVNLKGDASSFQALRVQFTSGGASGGVQSHVDLLIPSFQADPAKYNADARHPATLQALHPLKEKLGQSWTQAQYLDFTHSFCF